MTSMIAAQISTNAGSLVMAEFAYPSATQISILGHTLQSPEGSSFGQVGPGQLNAVVRRPLLLVERGTSDTLPIAIASNWSRLALSGIGAPLYARLMNLAKREPGWRGPGSRQLDAGSLRVFLEFWKLIRNSAVEPQLVLGPSGHIQAIWQRNSRRSLDLEFAATGAIYFGLFDGQSIQEGVDTVDQLANVLLNRTSEPLKWR